MADVKQCGNKNPPHRWKKGESGNPKGRKRKEDCLLSCLKAELTKPSLAPGLTNEQLIASMLVAQATKGNLKAAELILSYTTPKPSQAVDLNSKGVLELIVRWDGNKNMPGNSPSASSPAPG